MSSALPRTVGDHLRAGRRRRRMSQLDLALEAEISQKHLSFVESGRSSPSRDMVLRLAERLEVPLRERNTLLLAAGYAPHYPQRALDDPLLAPARRAIELILKGHEPYPALAVDRGWTILAANAAVAPLLALVADEDLLAPPSNALRLSLHPRGLAPHILNLAEWRTHLLERLRHQIAATGDERLSALLRELQGYPGPDLEEPTDYGGVLVPLRLAGPAGPLAFLSTTTVFGTPLDVTLSEIAVEAFFPADEATAAQLARSPAR
jgi:transcriptional regulator with XRE-family HTH domain